VHLDVRRQDEDPDLRELGADRVCGIETLGRVGGGHANVQHDEFWHVLAHQSQQFCRLARGADELKGRTPEQAGETLAYEEIILRDHHTDGSHGRQGVILPSASQRR
jgi:hypothetical protein